MKNRLGRQRILTPAVCLKLYERHGTLEGVQKALHAAGVLSPTRQDGLFARLAIRHAIIQAKPELANTPFSNERVQAAIAAMQKLEQQLGLKNK